MRESMWLLEGDPAVVILRVASAALLVVCAIAVAVAYLG
jgi:hypothetical protein